MQLLQSMRVHTAFEDFTLLGSQYKNQIDELVWHVAICSEVVRWPDKDKVQRYWIVAGKPEERLSGKNLEAAKEAISEWEAKPVLVERGRKLGE